MKSWDEDNLHWHCTEHCETYTVIVSSGKFQGYFAQGYTPKEAMEKLMKKVENDWPHKDLLKEALQNG